MRRFLNFLYDASAWLAATAMAMVLAMVLLSIISRQVGFNVSGTDAYAGYFTAAAGFLALAHTLKHNEHIRVTLIIGRLKGRSLHRMELWSLGVAVILSGLFAYYSVRMAWLSYDYHDISTSNDATPLWIPQIAMAFGTTVFFVAFVDECILEWRGRRVVSESSEGLHHE